MFPAALAAGKGMKLAESLQGKPAQILSGKIWAMKVQAWRTVTGGPGPSLFLID